MSITKRGVKFTGKKNRSRLLWATLFLVEGILSIFVYVSLAAHIIWPDGSQAATGVASVLSYEGRLTDASGNPLGGTGTDYCFKFAIYDDSDVDAPETKLWPSGSPTGQSITVIDGVFNALIGSADTLDYNFYTSDTVYLNVEAATKVGGSCTNGDETYETLRSRQRIAATGYAIAAANVYSTLLKTDIANDKVQIGTGTGTASQKFLALDVKNTSDTVGGACTTSGTMWYNSTDSRAYVCDNSTIQVVGNLGTIVGIKEQSNGSYITSGSVNFSAVNRLSISQDAQTLKFSVSDGVNAFGLSNVGNTVGNTGVATGTWVLSGQNGITLSAATGGAGVHTIGISAGGGGGGYALQDFANISWRGFITNVTNMTAISQRPIFVPFVLPGSLTWNQGVIEVSRATSGSNLFTMQAALYSFVNSTQISRIGSLQNTFSNSATASVSGIRRILWTGMGAAGTTLDPGHYVLGFNFSAANTASMNYSLRGGQTVGPPVGNIAAGANSALTATSAFSSLAFARFQGRYTATTSDMPGSIAFSQVQHWTSGYPIYFRLEST